MLDQVGSTSWHNRHLACFKTLDEILVAAGVRDPSILIIGPGGVTRVASWLLNDSAVAGRSRVRKVVGDLARYGDQVLRRMPVMPLASLEPMELHRTLSMPHRLIVADRSRRVLAAVRRQLPDAEIHTIDLGAEGVPVVADVVVAFNVVCRLEEGTRERGMANVAAAVKPGGWLLVDDRSARDCKGALGQFSEVASKIHQRRLADEP